MKLIVTSIVHFLLLPTIFLAQNTVFPDNNFEQILIDKGYDSGVYSDSALTAKNAKEMENSKQHNIERLLSDFKKNHSQYLHNLKDSVRETFRFSPHVRNADSINFDVFDFLIIPKMILNNKAKNYTSGDDIYGMIEFDTASFHANVLLFIENKLWFICWQHNANLFLCQFCKDREDKDLIESCKIYEEIAKLSDKLIFYLGKHTRFWYIDGDNIRIQRKYENEKGFDNEANSFLENFYSEEEIRSWAHDK